MSKFLHDNDDNAKAIAIPLVLSENSRVRNDSLYFQKLSTYFPHCSTFLLSNPFPKICSICKSQYTDTRSNSSGQSEWPARPQSD